jgi:hypothetical protein
MARIRSIKPEFWTSEAIARLPLRARLTFIALWSYVDDNGVGRDNEKLIAAELFPLEDDPRETVINVREDLATLAREGRVTRYTVDGKPFLHVTNWSEHQKIDRPNKKRYPTPDDERAVPLTCGNLDPRATLAQPSRTPISGSREQGAVEQGSGSREQGNEGAGEQRIPPTAGAVASSAPTSQTLIAEWIEHCKDRPPGKVVGQVAKEVGAMLSEGIAFADVRAGLAAWHEKRLHPSALPSIVHEVREGPGRPQQRKASTTDERVRQGLELAAHFAELDSQQLAIEGHQR